MINLFEDVLNDEVIDNLSDEEADKVLAILEGAGY